MTMANIKKVTKEEQDEFINECLELLEKQF